MQDFGKRLRKARMDKHLTQRQVADMLGIQLRSYQNFEQGNNTKTLERLVQMADALDVTTDYLLGRTGEAPSDE